MHIWDWVDGNATFSNCSNVAVYKNLSPVDVSVPLNGWLDNGPVNSIVLRQPYPTQIQISYVWKDWVANQYNVLVQINQLER